MKKKKVRILKLVEKIGKYFKDYDLHITRGGFIDIKFTPWDKKENQTHFCNDDLSDLIFYLEKFLFKLENPDEPIYKSHKMASGIVDLIII